MDKTIKILLILFAVVGVGLIGFNRLSQWHDDVLRNALDAERKEWQRRVAELEARVEELVAQVDAPPGPADLTGVFGPDRLAETAATEPTDCRRITTQVAAFFSYLDSKGYVTEAGQEMRAERFFDETFTRLAATPPTNVGEMNNLYGLLRNVTHFYRVLGKDRLLLIKQMLENEVEVTEPAMAVMFAWMTGCDENRPLEGEPPKLQPLYEYAAFFLNTMGGRGYLLRRDSKTRMLINYYALLILDVANDHRRNIYGIDIRPHLDFLLYDINNQRGLMYRERYLSRLAALRNKYL